MHGFRILGSSNMPSRYVRGQRLGWIIFEFKARPLAGPLYLIY